MNPNLQSNPQSQSPVNPSHLKFHSNIGELQPLNESIPNILNNDTVMSINKTLLESYGLFKNILDHSKLGIFAYDKNLCYTHWNPEAEKITGLSSEFAIGKSSTELFPELVKDDFIEALKRALAGEKVFLDVRKQANANIYYEAHILPIYETNGEVNGGVIIYNDVTEIKQAKLAMEKKNDELIRTNKELNDFAYIVAHDLKAPLRAITNLATWIVDDINDGNMEEVGSNLELLTSRVKLMEALISGVLDYSRSSKVNGEERHLDLNLILKDVVFMLAPADKFTVKLSEDFPLIYGDDVRVSQVFSNLMSNAIKYHDKPQGTITINWTDSGDFYEFNVQDDGPGIDPEYHEKVFQFFQTLQSRDSYESTGVGLTIVKKIIESKGGSIRLESEVGAGANFIFTWPKVKQ